MHIILSIFLHSYLYLFFDGFHHILLHVSTSKVNVTIIIFYITSLSPLLSSHCPSLLDISLISVSPLFCIFLSFSSVFVSFFYCSFLTHSLSLVTFCLLSQHQLIPSHLTSSHLSFGIYSFLPNSFPPLLSPLLLSSHLIISLFAPS